MKKCCFQPANILLPDKGVDLSKWAVIACDQYTSQPDYWQQVEKIVGDGPSTLNLVFPEIYLKEGMDRVSGINSAMKDYLDQGLLSSRMNGYVLVERDTQAGCRLGLIGVIDLEEYDYTPGSQALIRATEGTVPERIPPRVAIRKNAILELPHVMLLMDDRNDHIIENLYENRHSLEKIYDTDLMLGGGHIKGYAVKGHQADELGAAFENLQAKSGGFLFAVGDGNHSLATAKTCWKQIASALSEEQKKNHPARYAMVEVVNLHCDALQFEPIHRLVLNAGSARNFMEEFEMFLESKDMYLVIGDDIVLFDGNERFSFSIAQNRNRLAVDLVQEYLNEAVKRMGCMEVDYIHGDDELKELVAGHAHSCGILLPPIEKNSLFPAIKAGGVLPRKTFSMGHAFEKRYYMECRSIA